VCGQANPDVRDQRRTTRSALFDYIDNVATVHNGEVRAFSDGVDKFGHERSADECERLLTQVAGSQVVRRHPESPPTVTVDNKTVLSERGEQVICRGTRDAEGCRNRCRRDRCPLAGEIPQDGEGLIGCRNLNRV
jgi:hypothetical protein